MRRPGAGSNEHVGAVRMLTRSDVRRRWRSTVVLALLVGVVGAVVLAAAAGARRSGSSLERFNAFSRSSSLEISVGIPTARQLTAFRATPGIVTTAMVRGYALQVDGRQDLAIGGPLDDKIGNTVDRSRLISGRRANPARADEVTIGAALATQDHLHVGSRLDLESFTPGQIYAALHNRNPGNPAGPRPRLRVVGIDLRPLDLSDRAAAGGVVILTPAFNAKYGTQIGLFTESMRVRIARAADVPRIAAKARQIFGKAQTFDVQSVGVEAAGVRDAINVLTLALWILAGVTALAGLVAVGIVLTRDLSHSTHDQSTLRALGVTRSRRIMATGARALIVAAGGALLAGLGALAASPLFPLGLARRADPAVGLHADWVVLAIGTALLGAIVLVVAFVAAWRAARPPALDRAARRTSPVVEGAARAGLRPTATNGLRMALQAGRGDEAVPLRSALAGAVLGVAGITAVLVFAASLTHLVATPRLSGWNWDLKTEVGTSPGTVCADSRDYGIARVPGIEAVAAVCNPDVQVDNRPVIAWGFESLHGTIDPEVVAGHAPRAADEIALGSATLSGLHAHIGDLVPARGPNGTRNYRIVGRIVFPTLGEPQPLADGAAFTAAGLIPIINAGSNESHFLLARLAPGTDRAAILRQVNVLILRNAANRDLSGTGGSTTPVEIKRLQQIGWFPVTLTTLLTALALIAVGHALVTSVRRRRRELALFKTMGFVSRQVAATVAWQATTLAVVGLAVGIPIGVIAGRGVWKLIAGGLGVSPVSTIPLLTLLLTALGALVLVNVIAFVPARNAARTRPAVALRSE